MADEPDADARISKLFPTIHPGIYHITSPKTEQYNCVAWAVGDSDRWWQPVSYPEWLTYWPPGIPADGSFECFVQMFIQAFSFVHAADGNLESGFTKLALYRTLDGDFGHVARQREDGAWLSKLGELEDIEHANLQCLEGPYYGYVKTILKRPVSAAHPPAVAPIK